MCVCVVWPLYVMLCIPTLEALASSCSAGLTIFMYYSLCNNYF